jgi:methionyl-tRNA synthetase
VATILNLSLQITANLAIAFEPFLPFSAAKLRRLLNMTECRWDSLGRTDLLPADHVLETPELLFEKIEDAAIEAQVQRLLDTKEKNKQQQVTLKPAKDSITYDAFTGMDLRVGTVLAAERVPKTGKLMKLTIDTGLDTRTVVSGIAEHYSPEEVIGRQVCLLANLQPRTLKGLESQGMILMAEDAVTGKLVFLQPADLTKNGSVVS